MVVFMSGALTAQASPATQAALLDRAGLPAGEWSSCWSATPILLTAWSHAPLIALSI